MLWGKLKAPAKFTAETSVMSDLVLPPLLDQ